MAFLSLRNRVALVTGAGRGIGQAIALALGREGAKVAANDINPDNPEATAAAIVAAGGEAAAWVADVSRKHMIQNMIDEVVQRWGRIDILVNSARVKPHAPAIKMDEWDWERTLAVNLKGPFLVCQSVGRIMQDAGGGVIVNVVSGAQGPTNRAAFIASQAGLIGFTRECAHEFAAHNIRVNAVCCDPDSDTLAALCDHATDDLPNDVVNLVSFLCADVARSISGRILAATFIDRE